MAVRTSIATALATRRETTTEDVGTTSNRSLPYG
jgi:hypothetical protein